MYRDMAQCLCCEPDAAFPLVCVDSGYHELAKLSLGVGKLPVAIAAIWSASHCLA
jgi:hypothetical protein